MNQTDFQPDAPGKLVQTVGYNLHVRNGIPESISITGLAFVPDPLPPLFSDPSAFVGCLYPAISAAEQALVRLDATISGLPNPEILLSVLRRREAKLSSQIENTIASIEEVALVEIGRGSATSSDANEVYNYLRALRHAESTELPLCERLFNQLHTILMQGARGDDKQPGRYRTTQNHIGGADRRFEAARFVPPPPGQILQECMRDLERYLNPDDPLRPRTARLPPIIEAAIAHYQFEAIHPYTDGNGRLGRLIASLMLARSGPLTKPIVYISDGFERRRREYYDHLLSVSTHGHWAPWCEFFCNAVAAQATDALKRTHLILRLRDEYIQRVTKPRWSSLLPDIVHHLFAHPAVRATDIRDRAAVSITAAQKIVDRLVEVGILNEITGNDYARVYVARGIVEVIENDHLDNAPQANLNNPASSTSPTPK